MKVGVFHPGTQHSWQVALGFQEIEGLRWYATSVFYQSGRWPYVLERLLPQRWRMKLHAEFLRRFDDRIDPRLLRTSGLMEWLETGLRRAGLANLSRKANAVGNEQFCRYVIGLIDAEPVDALWGFNTSSLEVFEYARRRGIRCILDQTIGHLRVYNELMAREARRYPEYFDEIPTFASEDEIRRNERELELADTVLVGCEYARQTLIENNVDASKIRLLAYGCDERQIAIHTPRQSDGPCRFVFVGQVNVRKGAHHILRAFDGLDSGACTLTMVGPLQLPEKLLNQHRSRFPTRFTGAVPRSEVQHYLADADVFIFPSLFEGGAIVLDEARAASLPIICCRSSGRLDDNPHCWVLDDVEQELRPAIEGAMRDIGRRRKAAGISASKARFWSQYRTEIASVVDTP